MISIQQKFAAPIPTRGFPKHSAQASTVSRMAQKMLEVGANDGVDEQTLILAGFTRDEIAQHAAAAVDLANLSGRAG
jgi:hypothetical protein